MKKKGLILLVCLALVSTLAVNGTFATELQRAVEVVTEYFKTVLAVGAPQKNEDVLNVTLHSESTGVLVPAHYEGVFEWSKVNVSNGAVAKPTYVSNPMEAGAFVRICIAVKQTENDVLHVDLNSSDTAFAVYTNTNYRIGEETFTLYTFDYKSVLKQNEATPYTLKSVALSKETTNEDIKELDDNFIQIRSFAIQASDFVQTEDGALKADASGNPVLMNAVEALNSALGNPASADDFRPFN